MIKHGMDVVRRAIQFLNPGQIPACNCVGCTTLCLGKVRMCGLKHMVCCRLHIEMAIWNTFGDYLELSGWTTALTQAGIASSGTADSFLKAAHLTRTRHAHQVSALALSKLQEDAFHQTA